jgi:hypothetical protein
LPLPSPPPTPLPSAVPTHYPTPRPSPQPTRAPAPIPSPQPTASACSFEYLQCSTSFYSGTTVGYRDDTGYGSPERLWMLVVREPTRITVNGRRDDGLC